MHRYIKCIFFCVISICGIQFDFIVDGDMVWNEKLEDTVDIGLEFPYIRWLSFEMIYHQILSFYDKNDNLKKIHIGLNGKCVIDDCVNQNKSHKNIYICRIY